MVYRYVLQDNNNAAVQVVLQIQHEIAALADHPGIGRPGLIKGTKELVLTKLPHIIPYRVKNGVIEILRVYHQARKWPLLST